MEKIYNLQGEVIKTSQNLRGIREHVSLHVIEVLTIEHFDRSGGKLLISFENGDSYETNFASFSVLKGFIKRWHNAYGAPLLVNGEDHGYVSNDNPVLT